MLQASSRHGETAASNDRTSISADGRYVAFESLASNLVSGDSNGARDIFVKDTVSGATTRVSTDAGGVQGGADSLEAAISADSRYVTFSSFADNLVTGDTNNSRDVFLAATDVINTCGKPPLSVTKTGAYWASNADYQAQLLSVGFIFSNSGAAPAYMAKMVGAINTNGVLVATPMLVSMGNILAGSAYAMVIKYSIPVGVGSFSTSVYITAKDGCNASYSYPGPYPGLPGGR